MNFLQELLDLASDTSPGISASSLSQSLSSLLPISSCSWSSSGCIAGLLNDSVNIPMVSYHSTYLCIFAELASLLANSITHSCKMSCGFTAGRKRGDRHFAVCSDQWPADFKVWNNWSVTSLIYVVVCGLKLVAKLVLYALTQLNPMVDEIWTMLLGNWCYIINRDDWICAYWNRDDWICAETACISNMLGDFLCLINGSGPVCPILGDAEIPALWEGTNQV